jgi:hypothetical protein
MELTHIKVTCVRRFTTERYVDGIKKTYVGMELIGKTKTRKIKFESELIFELPWKNKDAQIKALMENISQLLLIEEKKLEYFYRGALPKK